VVCRPATAAELATAVELLVPEGAGLQQLEQMAALARTQQAAGASLHVAHWAGRLVASVLPVHHPGRTMLLLLPHRVVGRLQQEAVAQLAEMVCAQGRARGMHLAQCLLEDGGARAAVERAGFGHLADLAYLHARPPAEMPVAELPPGWTWQDYRQDTHGLFAQAIAASYKGSLDCPALTGLRSMDDVLAGHMATGVFEPELWGVACDGAVPAAVLLLSPLHGAAGIELVYLGVHPDYRGRGLGDLLMRRALRVAADRGRQGLSLAVDAANAPALKLYWRHGFRTVGRKAALLRVLA
jgi:mycothiol synthase